MLVAEIAAGERESLRTHRASRCLVARIRVSAGPGRSVPVILAQPTGYMNESGGAVAGLLKYFGVPADRLVVVHDDLDLPFATVRLKRGGGEGGHNGLRSVSRSVGTRDYLRLRLGIGRPPGRTDPADFVLRDFSATERTELPFLLGDAGDALRHLVTHGLGSAQQAFHRPSVS